MFDTRIISRGTEYESVGPPVGDVSDFRRLAAARFWLLAAVEHARIIYAPIKDFAEVGVWAERERDLCAALFATHWPLAVYAIKRVDKHGDPEDVEQVAAVQLVKAMRLFDPWAGYEFSTYAVHAVTNGVIRECNREHRAGREVVADSATAYAASEVEADSPTGPVASLAELIAGAPLTRSERAGISARLQHRRRAAAISHIARTQKITLVEARAILSHAESKLREHAHAVIYADR